MRIHSNPRGNVLFVASDRAELRFVHAPDFAAVHSSVKPLVEAAFTSVMDTNPDHGRVLTDDFNPVEFFDAKNREKIRRDLAMSLKSDEAQDASQ